MKPLTWFQERVGKKIRRNAMKTDNIFARKLGYKPVVIADKDHDNMFCAIRSLIKK